MEVEEFDNGNLFLLDQDKYEKVHKENKFMMNHNSAPGPRTKASRKTTYRKPAPTKIVPG